MDSARWQIIKGLMAAALDLPAAEREAFLVNEADEEVRSEVRKLLEAHDRSDDFIERPLLIERGVAESETDDSNVGRQIDDYLILERIGTGGMGAVYLAERVHSDFKQKVALKLIKRGMDSDAILVRFERERQILSSLDHPNIARLIDGGVSSDGMPFFVMEYVEGRPLTQFCREMSVPLEERLGIFLQVCSAVDHAHKNLIVHRDLKPSNILVTGEKVPKLLDFGIAKLLSADADPASTNTAGIMLTPEYASPEQILGKPVTTAADIYSLGVILYELLSGAKPYRIENRGPEAYAQLILTVEPVRPSAISGIVSRDPATGTGRNQDPVTTPDGGDRLAPSLDARRLRGDLDNIILKAIRKEPAERYESVRQFSDDILRFLAGRPVLARPQTIGYRFGKYIKRHRISAIAAALVLLSLVTGASIAVWQGIVASRERNRAEQRFNDVRGLASTILFDHYERIKTLPGATEAREKLVTDALQYLDKLAADSGDDPELQRDLVAGYRRLADLQGSTVSGGNNGQLDAAGANLLKALAIQEKLAAGTEVTIDDRRNLGKLYQEIGLSLEGQLDLATRTAYAQKGLGIFRGLAENDPQGRVARKDLANSLWVWAQFVRLKGDDAGAIAVYEQAVGLYEQLAAEDPADLKPRRNAALTYKNIGSVYFVDGDYQKALEYYQKALGYDLQTSAAAPDDTERQMDLSFSYKSIAKAQSRLGNKEGTFAAFQNAMEIQEKVLNTDAKNKFAGKALFGTYSAIAEAYLRFDDLARSAAFYGKCREMLAGKAPDQESNSDKVVRASYLSGYAELLTRQAELERSTEKKLAAYRSARSDLTDAAAIYDTMLEQNTLDPAYRNSPNEVAAALDRVDQAIARLR